MHGTDRLLEDVYEVDVDIGWMSDGACLEHAEHDFTDDGTRTRGRLDALRAVCSACLVRDECRAYAEAIDAAAGFWAGETTNERRQRVRRSAA